MSGATTFPELTQRFEVPGFSLAWDVWGDAAGPPLVFAHGFTGSSFEFSLHIEALAEHRRVYFIDHRGHGLSSHSGTDATYTVDHIVDDLLAWVGAVVAPDGEPLDLIGHSMGGRVALRFALARRDLLRSLVLMDATAWSVAPAEPAAVAAISAFFSSLDPAAPMPQSPASRRTR